MYMFCEVHLCFVKSKKITWPVVVILCSVCAEIQLSYSVDFASADYREHTYSGNAVRFQLHHVLHFLPALAELEYLPLSVWRSCALMWSLHRAFLYSGLC